MGIRLFRQADLDHGQRRSAQWFSRIASDPIFLLTTLLISSVFYFLIIKSGHMSGGWGAYVAGLMWSPGFAALLTCKLLHRDLRSIGWKWGKTRYEVVGLSIPLGYSIVIYGFVWLTGLGGVYNKSFVDQITNSFGSDQFQLGRASRFTSFSQRLIHSHTRFCDRHRRGNRQARLSGNPELAKKHGFPRLLRSQDSYGHSYGRSGIIQSRNADCSGRTMHQYPKYYGGRPVLASASFLAPTDGGKPRPTVLVLMGGSELHALIACTNVAGLLWLVERTASGRLRPERLLALRAGASLSGADRESGLFAAGGSGDVLAGPDKSAFCSRLSQRCGDRWSDAGPACSRFCRLGEPAYRIALWADPGAEGFGSDFNDALKTGGRGAMGAIMAGAFEPAGGVEIAFSIVLLTGCGTDDWQPRNLLGVSLGFNPEDVVTMRLSLSEARYSIARTAAFSISCRTGCGGCRESRQSRS